MSPFPRLADWKPTRQSLHLYSRVLGAVRGALSEPHPLWWHISLRVEPAGLGTGELSLRGGGARFALTLDLEDHRLRLDSGGERRDVADLRAAPTGRALGEATLAALAAVGPPVEPARERWDDAGERRYDAAAAAAYRGALAATAELCERFRSGLTGERSPVQLWPHHFDLSFEWLSERTESYEEEGEIKESRAQIGFGFSPGDDHHPEAYYYATPWPFEEALTRVSLPEAALWLTDPWKGALLPYEAVAGGDGETLWRLFETVYRAAAPGLFE